MHLELEDEDALLAVIRAGVITEATLRSPVVVARTQEGLRIQPSRALAKGARTKAERAGARVRPGGVTGGVSHASWLEAVACRPGATPEPPLPEVLFVLGPGEGFADLSGSLLRLGHVEQQILEFTDPEGCPRAAVRVPAPSFYLVLRALEGEGLRAYSARPGGAWIELGFEHPLSDQFEAPEGHLVLVPGAGPWLTPPDGPWVRIEDRLDVAWPSSRRLDPRRGDERLQVELRLEPSCRAGPARLWVLREDGAARLERLLSTLPEGVARGLQFARLGEGIFVLRSPDLGEPPPALDLQAEAYAPRPDLPRLHLPEQTTIAPPLGTALLAAQLAPNEDTLVWVRGGSPLVVERAAEASFRPLVDFVDYVIDAAAPVLSAWASGAIFDFDRYRGQEMAPAAPTSAPADNSRRTRGAVSSETPEVPAALPSAPEPAAAPVVFDTADVGPDAANTRALDLERAMAERPPGQTERSARWLELGRALAGAGRLSDAHHAFARAAFFVEDPEPTYLAWGAAMPLGGSLSEALEAASGAPAQVAAALLAADAHGGALDSSLGQRWLDRAEAKLPVHIAWLVRIAFARHSGGDLLGMLRTRDGITSRIEDGLALGRDVPSFVRRLDDADRGGPAMALRGHLDALWGTYLSTERERSWNEADEALTRTYVSRLIHWGHARLGAVSAQPSAVDAVDAADPVHGAVLGLFEARIAQAREGLELSAPVDPALRAGIEALPAFVRFKVERLWLGSVALGGFGAQDAFRRWAGHKEITPLPKDVGARREELDRRLASTADEAGGRRVLSLLSALPEAAARAMFPRVLGWAEALDAEARAMVYEELLGQAGHLDRAELVGAAIEALGPDLESDPVVGAAVLGRRARVLVRAGLGGPLQESASRLRARLQDDDVPSAQARLHLAVAAAAAGDTSAAPEEIQRAQGLLGLELRAEQHLSLVRALALTLARTSAEQAAGGVLALAPRIAQVTDKFSTNSHFCVSVLHFMESMVLALTGRDLTIGPAARAWLDDDEAHLRERMHEDLRGYDR